MKVTLIKFLMHTQEPLAHLIGLIKKGVTIHTAGK